MRAHYPDWDITLVPDDDHRGNRARVGPAARVIDSSATGDLPRLLYIGDVAVADTFAGEALLFRLLRHYPPAKIAIVCGVRRGMPALPDVAYHDWSPLVPRLLHSRFSESYCLWRAWRYCEVPWPIAQIATQFRPDAILTISHVSGWLCAWQIAADRGIPFHLIAHDDLVYANRFPQWSRPWAERKFGEAYRAARSRFCISDNMAAAYRGRYGASGLVIYPTRNSTGPIFDTVAPRTLSATGSLTFGYGGSVLGEKHVQQVMAFARAAGARGHRLLLFTPQFEQFKALVGAESQFLDVRAPISSAELIVRLRAEADCLLLAQPFGADNQELDALAFPTKWADYSAIGLPVLAWVPPMSSSARFVEEHPGCAELVTIDEAEAIGAAISRLGASADHRRGLAETLIRDGRGSFSPEAAWQTFSQSLTGGPQ